MNERVYDEVPTIRGQERGREVAWRVREERKKSNEVGMVTSPPFAFLYSCGVEVAMSPLFLSFPSLASNFAWAQDMD